MKRFLLLILFPTLALSQSFPVGVRLEVDTIKTYTQSSILNILDSLRLAGTFNVTGDATFGNSITGDTVLLGGATATGAVRFHDASEDGFYISLIGSEGISSNKTVTLPNITGTVAMMTTSNSGDFGLTGDVTADQFISSKFATTLPFTSKSTSGTTIWNWGIFSTDSTWRLEKSGLNYPILVYPATGNVRFATSIEAVSNVVADSARIGTASNHVAISNEQGITLVGEATVWDDLRGTATSGKQGQTSKPEFNYDSLTALFPQDSTEILYFEFQFPHTYKLGSTIYLHVHWKQTAAHGSAPGDTVVFAMEYKWYPLGGRTDSVPWSWIKLDRPEYAYTTGTIHQMQEPSAGISGVGQNHSSIILIKLKRRNAGGPAGNVEFLSFDIHYEIDTMGEATRP